MSAHVFGEALVRAAIEANLTLSPATDVREDPGQGIRGTIDSRAVAAGSHSFVLAAGVPADEAASATVMIGRGSGEAHVLLVIDGTSPASS
jgi:cation transport ATPase